VKKKTKLILGLLGTLLVFLIAVLLFLRYEVRKSFPEYTGSISCTEVRERVRVYRDGLGVPHIFSENDEDLMFAMGYVHAQDRLWQMELSRRAGEGKLSEVFGKLTVDFDRMFRTIGFGRLAERLATNLHPESRRLLGAYSSGVNFFIQTHPGKLPIEFDILGIRPKPWTIQHSLIIVRLQAWELNLAWWTELTLGDLVMKLGEEKAREVFPGYPENAPFIVPTPGRKKYTYASSSLREVYQAYRTFFGLEGVGFGSNSWTVSGRKSLTGKPLLANDPHLSMPVPSRWYEIHLSGGGFNVAGVSLAGVPGVVIGRNSHIAWGLTNGMIDDADFYIERLDSLHPNQYLDANQWRDLMIRAEEILIRGQRPDTLIIRETHRGPIVSDTHSFPMFEFEVHKTELEKNFPLSLRWTGFELSDEVRAIVLVNKANNWTEFRDGLREFTVPGQNFIYADDRGNIGYALAARVPVRKRFLLPSPNPGWTTDGSWMGFIPFEKLPHLFNPPENSIATANNKIVDDSYPYYLSNLWEPPSRITRIEDLLKSKEVFSVEDFRSLQSDVVSPHAREIVPYILRAFDGMETTDDDVKASLTYLRNWDFAFRKDDVATSIFNAFFLNLLRTTYSDEMGRELFANYLLLSSVPYRVTSKLLHDSASIWFDDVTTEARETRDEIIRKSLLDALAELRVRLGGELKTWRWGRLHEVTFEHLFGRLPGMGRVFNIGPFPTGGASTTINSGEYSLQRPYKHLVGASMRQIVDLSDSSSFLIVITSGESGQPLHRHYSDQTPLWLNGEYHRLIMDRSQIEQSGWDLLTFQPTRGE
jgi:penicillin amidase